MNRLFVFALLVCLGAAMAFAEGLIIGAKVDKVTVQDLKGNPETFATSGQVTVVTFISGLCPVSNDYNDRMSAVFNDYSKKGVKFVFVNSNTNEPASQVAEHARTAQFTFPVYKDADAVLAEKFGATVTPESYVFDKNGALQYHGYVDDSRNVARVKTNGLRDAIDGVMAGRSPAKQETKAFGCTIKRARKTS